MKKIYISGPISGLPLDRVKENFRKAKTDLAVGYCLGGEFEPVNPLNNGLPTNATWEEHLRADLRLLLDCDAIYMLEGWEKSRGARIEYFLGVTIGLDIYNVPRYNRNSLIGNYPSPYFPVEIEEKQGKLKSFLSYLFNR